MIHLAMYDSSRDSNGQVCALVVLAVLCVPDDGFPSVQVYVLDSEPANLGFSPDLLGKKGHDRSVEWAVRCGRPEGRLHLLAACHICNGLKGSKMFETVDQAKAFLLLRWEKKGIRDELS